MSPPSAPRTARAGVACALTLLFLGAACRDETPAAGPDVIDVETFVATYVDLRATALRADGTTISDDDRAAVLARHSVTAEDLTAFAEAHGTDVAFMRDVWDEVERRLDAQRPSTESEPSGSVS